MAWIALAVAWVLGAGCGAPPTAEVEQHQAAVTAYCTATVNGVGQVDVESDYLPHVVQCENGGAPPEALKAQAVAARSYLYYKLDTSGSVNDGTSDQVYSCGRTPTAAHIQAVQETAGIVLRYSGETICAFFVAGGIPSASDCVWASGDSDPTGTEHYVTYNWGLSGSGIEQTSLGWVNPGNVFNRGCQSQNGASCLANQGWGYEDILRFYYGDDIGIEQAVGSCVTPTECTSGQEETRDCDLCGTERRTCSAGGTWGSWGACEGQGPCEPDQEETQACGECGEQRRTCTSGCAWGEWGACEGVATDAPCDTGEPGLCGQGVARCDQATLVCEPIYTPQQERCDGQDDDCNGQADDGLPPVMGDPPPGVAAELVVAEVPAHLRPAEPAEVALWARNRGAQPWQPGDLVLRALGDGAGGPSQLHVVGAWESPETVITLGGPVAPGDSTEIRFQVATANELTEPLSELFWLYRSDGEPVACPLPAVTVEISPGGDVVTSRPDAGPGVQPLEHVVTGCSCGAGGPSPRGGAPVGLLVLALLSWLGWRRGRVGDGAARASAP